MSMIESRSERRRTACRAAGEDREVIAAADIDGTFDVDGAVFNEA